MRHLAVLLATASLVMQSVPPALGATETDLDSGAGSAGGDLIGSRGQTRGTVDGSIGNEVTVGTRVRRSSSSPSMAAWNAGDLSDPHKVSPTPRMVYGGNLSASAINEATEGRIPRTPDASSRSRGYAEAIRVADSLGSGVNSFTANNVDTAYFNSRAAGGVFRGATTAGLRIELTQETLQGQHEYVAVTMEDSPVNVGGFDLLMTYDRSAMNFQLIVAGDPYDECDWEYLAYRTWLAPSYEPHFFWAGIVRVIAISDMNDGANHPTCYGLTPPFRLFTLDFLVTDEVLFECRFVPIRWFWADCGDNSVSSVTGDTLYVSHRVYDYDSTDLTDTTSGFPSYRGVQAECLVDPDGDGFKIPPFQLIDFINGGVNIACAESLDARGDINLNGVPNEIADAVNFIKYFIYGLSAFSVNLEGQIEATDVNADGLTLTIGDLVYLIRIIVGDALPHPKLEPLLTGYGVKDGVVSVEAAMGAAYVVVEGNATPTLLARHMEMEYAYDAGGNVTRVLVYSSEEGALFTGGFLDVDGKVVSIEMATYEGAPVTLALAPTEFVMHQNYPNPFNATTAITFALPTAADYKLVIFNVVGEEVTSFEGHGGSGLVTVEWDASAYASGVYLYQLIAGSFTETRKMVLLK